MGYMGNRSRAVCTDAVSFQMRSDDQKCETLTIGRASRFMAGRDI